MTRDRNEQLEQIIADYQQAQESGHTSDEAALIAAHPEFDRELRSFFEAQRNAKTAPMLNSVIAPRPALETGRNFGDYELLEEIARGGMGVVYKARQISLNRIVAVKMILSGPLASETEIKRLQIEAEAAANLHHPNIVAVHEAGRRDGHSYLTMEYIDGQTLSEIVRENPLPPKVATRYVKEIAEAIDYAHRQGTLHRDLKPSNVMIDRNDRVRITDFGLAMRVEGDSDLTRTGQILGTPAYMPPEQARIQRELIGPASDVYSIGAVLYKLLTGRPPFQADTDVATLWQLVETEPVSPRLLNPAVPKDLETICLKCLEKDPHKRYATAQQLADDLNCFLLGKPILARPIGRAAHAWRWCRRHPSMAGMMASVALLVAGVFAGSLWYINDRGVRLADRIRQQTKSERRIFLLERGIEEALDDAELLRKQSWTLTDRLPEWEAKLQSARASHQHATSLAEQAPDSISPALITRLEKVDRDLSEDERDQQFAARQDEIMFETTRFDYVTLTFPISDGPVKIRGALADYGVLIGKTPVEEVVERFRNRPAPAQTALIAALDLSLLSRDSDLENYEADIAWLVSLLRAVDGDPWRTSVRRALIESQTDELIHLVQDADLSSHPTNLLLLLSTTLFNTGKQQESLSFLNRLHADRPDDIWVNLMAGGYHQQLQQFDQAAMYYQVASGIRPDSAGICLMLGNILLDQNKPDEAIPVYRKAIELEPEFPDSYLNLGLLFEGRQKWDEAEACYRDALKIDFERPIRYKLLNNLGGVLLRQDRFEEAKPFIHRCLELQPKLSFAYCNLGLANRFHAMMQFDLNQLRESETYFADAIGMEPGNPQYHEELGIVLAERNEFDEAENQFQQALELHPDSARSHINLGVILAIRNQTERAQHHFSRAAEIQPQLAPEYFLLPFALQKPEQLATALGVYRTLIEQFPGDFNVQCVLGNLLLRQNLRNEAIVHFQQCLNLSPHNFLAWHELGNYCRETGDASNAIYCLELAANKCPQSDAYQADYVNLCYTAGELPRAISNHIARIGAGNVSARTYLRLLSLLRYTGDLPRYREWCQRMFVKFEGDEFAVSELVYVHVVHPDVEIPAELLNQAMQHLDRENAFDLLLLGMLHFRLGQLHETAAFMENSLEAEGHPVRKIQAGLYLALAQLKLGRTDQAQASIREASSNHQEIDIGRIKTFEESWDLQPWGAVPALWRTVQQEINTVGGDVSIPELPPAYQPPATDDAELAPLVAPRPDQNDTDDTSP